MSIPRKMRVLDTLDDKGHVENSKHPSFATPEQYSSVKRFPRTQANAAITPTRSALVRESPIKDSISRNLGPKQSPAPKPSPTFFSPADDARAVRRPGVPPPFHSFSAVSSKGSPSYIKRLLFESGRPNQIDDEAGEHERKQETGEFEIPEFCDDIARALAQLMKSPDREGFVYLRPQMEHDLGPGSKRIYCLESSYFLKVVPYQECCESDYFTMSLDGIGHFIDGKMTEFVSIDQWKRERELFISLLKIPIFNAFRIWKPFLLWRNSIKRNKSSKMIKIIRHKLLYLESSLLEVLRSIRQAWLDLEVRAPELILLSFSSERTLSLFEFSKDQSQKTRQLQECIKSTFGSNVGAIKHAFLRVFESNATSANSAITESPKACGAEKATESNPNSKGTYALRAAKRAIQSRLFSFARLCDYVVASSLHNMASASVAALQNKFDPKFTTCTPILHTDVILDIQSSSLQVRPSFIEFSTEIDGIASYIGRDLVCTGLSFVHHPDLNIFWKTDAEPFLCTTNDLVKDVLMADQALNSNLRSLSAHCKRVFEKVAGKLKDLNHQMETPEQLISLDFPQIEAEAKANEAYFYDIIAWIKALKANQARIKLVPEKISCMFVEICCGDVKKEFLSRPSKYVAVLENLILCIVVESKHRISDVLIGATAELTRPCQSVGDFVSLRTLAVDYDARIPMLEIEVEKTCNKMQEMLKLDMTVPPNTVVDVSLLPTQFENLKSAIDAANEMYYRKKNHWIDALELECAQLRESTSVLKCNVQDTKYLDAEMDMLVPAEELVHQISLVQERSQQVSSWCKVLGLAQDGTMELSNLYSSACLRLELWKINREAQLEIFKAIDHNVKDFNVELGREKVQGWSLCLKRARRELPANSLAVQVDMRVERYKQLVDVCAILLNPAMKTRHWDKIFAITGHRVNPTRNATQDGFVKIEQILKMQDDFSTFGRISQEATEENSLEVVLAKLQGDWAKKEFAVVRYQGQNDTYIFSETDELQRDLDESLSSLAAVLASRQAEAVRTDAEIQQASLKRLQQYLDDWAPIQMNWIHLEPIFSSADIQRQLPSESKQFAWIEREYKRIMKGASADPNCIKLCSLKGLRENINTLQHNFERIRRSLQDYLEMKRMAFPRFFFLSDDELIQLLSKSRDLNIIQTHITKCFQGVKYFVIAERALSANSLARSLNLLDVDGQARIQASRGRQTFLTENSTESLDYATQNIVTCIQGMTAKEGESIYFDNAIKVRGEMENWLSLFEKQMVDSLRQELGSTLIVQLQTFSNKFDWMSELVPAQILLLKCQILWCQATEHAMAPSYTDESPKLFIAWIDGHNSSIIDQCTAIGHCSIQLQRSKLSAVLTKEIHHRDILQRLHQNKVSDIKNFDWQICLRCYWTPDPTSCQFRQISSCLTYTYEYWGATSRLVITSLTEKCYLTLTSALHLMLGGAPFGPAGTGKTETTKDLAKNLGRQCIVFNCGDNLDVVFMRNFFSGLAQCGAWACLDEFNRIDVEVLSVVAQYIITLQLAQKAGAEIIDFEGRTIKIVSSFGIFITMNPGSPSIPGGEEYAGRRELPDNLKALFRPCAMIIPDFEPVAEVMLFIEGFKQAKVLAKKLVQLYKLLNEQLSQAKHYDFGMRSIKSLLLMAALKKQQGSLVSEEAILLASICDSNIPKLTAADSVLFQHLMGDIGFEKLGADSKSEALERRISDDMNSLGFESSPEMSNKIVQFHKTTEIRFGILALGEPDSGKTTMISMAMKLMTQDPYYSSRVHCINPKSLSDCELYGGFVASTKEWQDGLAPTVFRPVDSKDFHTSGLQWIIFDGPIDALWIENMNTVLDDNQCLCLANGERLQLNSEVMRIIFEVDQVLAASPATISRLGVVFLPHNVLSPFSISNKKLQFNLQNNLPENIEKIVFNLFSNVLPKAISFVHMNCRPQLKSTAANLCVSCCELFLALLGKLKILDKSLNESKDVGARDVTSKSLERAIKDVFLFSLVWSVGANLDSGGRLKFNMWINTELHGIARFGRSDELAFDFFLSVDTWDVIHFRQITLPYSHSSTASFGELFVPTVDTVRYSHVLELLGCQGRGLLIHGHTGVGKTMMISQFLNEMTTFRKAVNCKVDFSSQMSSVRAQKVLERELEKKAKGKLHPRSAQKLIYFVDDVNLPACDRYGAQQPIEFLRQLVDSTDARILTQCFGYGGIYDRNNWKFSEVLGVTLMACCCPERNALPERFVKHLHLIHVVLSSDAVLQGIFSSILEGHCQNFGLDVRKQCQTVVEASLHVHGQIMQDLIPTPLKFHYIFNLRDLARVFQGLCCIQSEHCQNMETFIKLWVHEMQRVYEDRLVDASDVGLLRNVLHQQLKSRFKVRWSFQSVFEIPFLFGDFLKIDAAQRIYSFIDDHKQLSGVMQSYLDEYNRENSKTLDLVLFDEAIYHITRVIRALRFQKGHVLLIGQNGCGRQSAARLSSFIMGFSVFQVENYKDFGISQFHDDLKKILWVAGVEKKQTVFFLDESNVVNDAILDLVNSMLIAGDLQDIYSSVEKERINAEIKRKHHESLDRSQFHPLSLFSANIREHLHLILSINPMNRSLRDWYRKAPSILNCCFIDWYLPWSKIALTTVADGILRAPPISLIHEMSLAEITFEPHSLIGLCVYAHEMGEAISRTSSTHLLSSGFFPPKFFVDFLKLFLETLQNMVKMYQARRNKLLKGVSRMNETTSTVESFRQEIEDLKPVLQLEKEKVQSLFSKLSKEREDANLARHAVEMETKQVEEQATVVSLIREDAQNDLNAVLPVLDSAVRALNSLTRTDIVECKSFLKPPALVQVVMEAVCTLLREPVSWESSRKVLGHSDFMERLLNYDKDNIDPRILSNLQKYIDNPDFNPDQVGKVSKAAKGLCQWCKAIDVYARVAKEVEPKRMRLRVADDDLKSARTLLEAQCAKLSDAIKCVQDLEDQVTESEMQLMSLQNQMLTCENRLNRSSRLTSALGKELSAWSDSISSYASQLKNVVGDALISSAFINYCAPFNALCREQLISNVLPRFDTFLVTLCSPFKLKETLSSEIEILSWSANGLPADQHSVENSIIISHCKRWPLIIDPQLQACKWLRRTLESKGLRMVRFEEDHWLRALQVHIQDGSTCYIEGVSVELDPSLLPILQNHTFVKNNCRFIRFGEVSIEYNSNFRLIMSTKHSNPQFSPSVCNQTTIVNFSSSRDGLEEQLLADVVCKERPELEQSREKSIMSMANDQHLLEELQGKILSLLEESTGMILDNEPLVTTLLQSQKTSSIIASRFKDAQDMDAKILFAREEFRSAAKRSTSLYFVLVNLNQLNPLYYYSFENFKYLHSNFLDIRKGFSESKQMNEFIHGFTEFIIHHVSRGLYEKHRLIFLFSICIAIDQDSNPSRASEWDYLLGSDFPLRTDQIQIIDGLCSLNQTQKDICLQLEQKLPDRFGKLCASMEEAPEWAIWAHSLKPEDSIPWQGLLDIEKLILVKCFHGQRFLSAVKTFVCDHLNQTKSLSFRETLKEVVMDADCRTPILVALSPGSDPTPAILQAFQVFKSSSKNIDLHIVSMGQGQGPIAEKTMHAAARKGDWVLLSNLHFSESWLFSLEHLVDESFTRLRPSNNYRLFLSTYPIQSFPLSVLSRCFKLVCEPPKGFRSTTLTMLEDIDISEWVNTSKPALWTHLLSSLLFFHSVIKGRNIFNPVGWKEVYDFNSGDFVCAKSILSLFVEHFEEMQWTALKFVTGHIVYGGRITDDMDQRCLSCLMDFFYCDIRDKIGHVLDCHAKILAKMPAFSELQNYVHDLPDVDDIEIYGMHNNAILSLELKDSAEFLFSLSSFRKFPVSRDAVGNFHYAYEEGRIRVETLLSTLSGKEIPKEIMDPLQDNNPLDILLQHEISKCNGLLSVIQLSLESSLSALKGKTTLSGEMEEVINALVLNNIPRMWAADWAPNNKTLAEWTSDLCRRAEFFREWLNASTTPILWLAAFSYPRALLTACLQNELRRVTKNLLDDAARPNGLSLSSYGMTLVFTKVFFGDEDLPLICAKDAHNFYAHGLSLDQGGWDVEKRLLIAPTRGQIWKSMPVVVLQPVLVSNQVGDRNNITSNVHLLPEHEYHSYLCPVYQSAARRGGTSSSGQSSNLVICTLLSAIEPASTWILRGTAMILDNRDSGDKFM